MYFQALFCMSAKTAKFCRIFAQMYYDAMAFLIREMTVCLFPAN